MKILLSLLAVFLGCPGCIVSSDPAGDVGFPLKDRWAVSPDGTNRATDSSWTGVLGWRVVQDWGGGKHTVAVLTEASGLNPLDKLSRSGEVVEKRPMPEVFFLAGEHSLLLKSLDLPESAVRVYGTLNNRIRGGAVYADGKPVPAFVYNPKVKQWLRVWPMILVEKIEQVGS